MLYGSLLGKKKRGSTENEFLGVIGFNSLITTLKPNNTCMLSAQNDQMKEKGYYRSHSMVTKSICGAATQMASLLWGCSIDEINEAFTPVPNLNIDFPRTIRTWKGKANLSGGYTIRHGEVCSVKIPRGVGSTSTFRNT